MFAAFKLWKLASAIKTRNDSHEAYSAVLELGRLGGAKAVDLLIGILPRRDGLARSAARELGRLGDERALKPLLALLDDPEVSQSAAEALVKFGSVSVEALVAVLGNNPSSVRKHAAWALGEIGIKQAVEPLIQALQTDEEYSVRIASAIALGQLKDPRAIWVLVGTLKLRDETSPERQAALSELRNAATLAMRKIGDPLAAKTASHPNTLETAIEKIEQKVVELEMHPSLLGELSLLSQSDLVSVLKELIAASEEISWANLERREPVLAAYFISYDQRRKTAEIAGEELRRRGGQGLLNQVLERDLGSHAAILNWWASFEGEKNS